MLTEREEVEGKIKECAKACHGNLAGCWALMKEDKKTIEAANKGMSSFVVDEWLTTSTRAGSGVYQSTP